MKAIKPMSDLQYRQLREQAAKGEVRVIFHTFKRGELKQRESYGVYAGNYEGTGPTWVDTFDSVDQLMAAYPTAIRMS